MITSGPLDMSLRTLILTVAKDLASHLSKAEGMEANFTSIPPLRLYLELVRIYDETTGKYVIPSHHMVAIIQLVFPELTTPHDVGQVIVEGASRYFNVGAPGESAASTFLQYCATL